MKKLYDWDALFIKKKFKLQQGKDFTCSMVAMSTQIRNAASKRKKSIGVTVIGNTFHVDVITPQPLSRKVNNDSIIG